jgi:RimJ/RimL family protein N-acetyltransferase
MKPFPCSTAPPALLVETPRLFVRPWAETDASWFHALSQEPGLNSNTISNDPWRYRQASEAAARAQIEAWQEAFARTGLSVWPVFLRESSEPVGLCGIKPILPDGDAEPSWEMMYRFVTSCWGSGLATELARGLLEYGFGERRLERITGGVLPSNLASARVLEKIGMRLWRRISIQGVGALLYAITAQEREAGEVGGVGS